MGEYGGAVVVAVAVVIGSKVKVFDTETNGQLLRQHPCNRYQVVDCEDISCHTQHIWEGENTKDDRTTRLCSRIIDMHKF